MNINIQQLVPNYTCPKEIEQLNYFKQFNIYETVDYNDDINKSMNSLFHKVNKCNLDIKVCNVEYTTPTLCIVSTKIINTMEATSLDGQHLTGKNLIIIGELRVSLIISFFINCDKYNRIIKDITIPFSVCIAIPTEICNNQDINLRYLIEDVTIAQLCSGKSLVSATLLIQYID